MLGKIAVCCLTLSMLIAVTVTPFCGAMFSCGCTITDGARHCNVHHASGPRCQWCAGGTSLFLVVIGAVWVLTCTTTGVAIRRLRIGYGAALSIGFIAYGVWGGLVGLLVALTAGYPTWFGFVLTG